MCFTGTMRTLFTPRMTSGLPVLPVILAGLVYRRDEEIQDLLLPFCV